MSGTSTEEQDGVVSTAGRRSRVFYGWWVVFAGSGVRMLQGSLLVHAFATYLVLLERTFGWSRSELSLAFLLQRTESALLGPLEGWLVDRFGPRKVMIAGILAFAAGFFLLARVDSLVSFYIAMLVLALGSSTGAMLATSVAAVNWFRRRRAFVLSLLVTGMALGGPLQGIVVPAMEGLGWQRFAAVSGVIVLVVGLPLAAVVRWRPEDYGLLPDGDAAPAAAKGPAASSSGEAGEDAGGAPAVTATPDAEFTIGQTLRTRAFWFLSLGHASSLLVVTAVQVHMVAHINLSLGFSLGTAAFITALTTALLMVGTVVGGWLGDRFNKRLIIVLAMFGHMFAMLLVVFFSTFTALIAFAMLHGFSWGCRGPLISALRADYFGRASFGKVMGFSSMIIGLGTIIGPMFAGVTYDLTGSYRLAFATTAVAAGLASLFFVFAPPPPAPESREPAEAMA